MVCCEKFCNKANGLKPTLIMIFVQTIASVVNIGYKLVSNDGMNLSILVAYRFMFGAAFIVPVAFFAERLDLFRLLMMEKETEAYKKIAVYSFLCGLLGGSLGQNLYIKSLALTSATFASAMTNLIPAMTFLVAICLRLERLQWNTSAGKAKVFGTLLGIGGAMVSIFYKGPELNLWNTRINFLEITSSHHQREAIPHSNHQNLVLGLFLALASCTCYSLWIIVQAKAAEDYPCPYSITAMMSVWAAFQGTAFALCIERDWNQWILAWDIRLLTVVVAGVIGSGVMFTMVAWCVRMRGPLFVSVFNPLLLVLVAIVGSLFLQEKLCLGMFFGAILIVAGLYAVLWGKGKELKKASTLMSEKEQHSSQVQIDMPTVQIDMPPPLSRDDSSHGGDGSRRKSTAVEEEDERYEEKRVSQASSEVLGGL